MSESEIKAFREMIRAKRGISVHEEEQGQEALEQALHHVVNLAASLVPGTRETTEALLLWLFTSGAFFSMCLLDLDDRRARGEVLP